MPELPEAETIARELHRRLAGRTLGSVLVSRPDIIKGDLVPLSDALPGRRVVRIHRRAKRVIVDLDPPGRLVFRLGMTGSLTFEPTPKPLAKHTHLAVAVPSLRCELRFRDPRRFGGVWCSLDRIAPDSESVGEVGLEPLTATPAAFARTLDRRRQIKALLMDQRVIAGMGNIYTDEALYAAGIHPLCLASRLTLRQQAGLLQAIKSTLRRAIRFNGSTLMDYRDADGREGSFQRLHRVYQREGQRCRTCRAAIRRIIAAGRSTFLCPRCQPAPRLTAGGATRGSSSRSARQGRRPPPAPPARRRADPGKGPRRRRG